MCCRMMPVAFVTLIAVTAVAQELLCTQDGKAGINALPVSENRWQAKEISVPGGLKESYYKSLPNLDFFALEYGEGFPETPFDTTGTNTFRKVFGYSKETDGAGVRFGRGWSAYTLSRWGVEGLFEQSGDTEWKITYRKLSGWTEDRRFAVKGKGLVRVAQTIDMIVGLVKNTEVSGLELECMTKGVSGTIRSLRFVPRIVPLSWRRRFSLSEDPARAGLSMKNFANFTLRVNGRMIGEGYKFFGNDVRTFDLTGLLTAGLNEVMVSAETAGGYGPNASFFAELFAVTGNGELSRFDTDSEWEYSFDGKTWTKPCVGARVGVARFGAGECAVSTMPLHAGALDVRPDETNGYPVFDCDAPIRWKVRLPNGVKDPKLTVVARKVLGTDGRLLPSKDAPIYEGLPDGEFVSFEGLPVGAYDVEWTLISGGRSVDSLRNEMVVCGPLGQTEATCGDFEKVLRPRLKAVQSVDCTQDEKDETRFLDHSAPYGRAELNVGRVVDLGNGVRARETGPAEQSFFAYMLEVGRLGAPHILEVDVPDVREQTLYCWINESFPVGFCNNAPPEGSRSWPNATGSVTCGGIMPLSGHVKKMRIVFFPGSKNITVSFENGKRGGPAAVCGFRVYEVEGGLPALKVPKTERRYGNHNERPVFAAWGAYVNPNIHHETSGLYPNVWTAAFAAALNRTAYLRYCGHNASIEGAYMYESSFPTASGESCSTHAEFDIRYPMLKLYRHNGIHTFLGFEYLRSPIFIANGALDVSDREIQAGTARTIYSVRKDGRQNVGYMGSGLNFLNADVRRSMTNILGEIYARYAPIADVEGLFVVNGMWWMPGISTGNRCLPEDVGFDDDTIELFERETGVRLGCGWSGRGRFMRRHEMLNGKYAETWNAWRAKKLRDVMEELRGVVTRGERKWKVYPSGTYPREPINPYSRLGGTRDERSAYEAARRKSAGFPVELYGEGSGSEMSLLPLGEFGREVDLENYGSLFNPGSSGIRWRNDACYYTCGSLNEHWVNCRAAKKWWWRNNGVNVYDVKQSGENAFFDLVETAAVYTPRLVFHTWLDVNVTSAHAEECRRFVEGLYATPLDRNPQDVTTVKGVVAKRYGDAVQLVNATPWGVKGKVKVRGEGEDGEWEALAIPPYGIAVRKVGTGTLEGEFAMEEGCPYPDFAAAREAMSFEAMRVRQNRARCERGRPNQERLLAALAKDGVARIDAGASVETVDETGTLWLPDQDYGGGDTYGNEFTKCVDRGRVEIGNTKTPSIYRTESGGGSNFIAYYFPVPKGRYRLVCHVAETWDRNPGRIMDVTVNGVARKIDVWSLCGGRMRAGQFVFEDVDVPENGMIRYESTSGPIMSGFEIFRNEK